MSEYLQKIVYLTQAQYNTLKTNGTVGGYTGINDNYLYFITDEAMSASDLSDDFILPVNKGGTGKTQFTSGSLLVGNGQNALTEIGATDQNTPNTIVKRDSSGNFSAGKATLTEAKIGSISIAANKLTAVTSIDTHDGNGLLAYKPASWTGVTNVQWGVGTVNAPGVIRSNNSDLLHSRNGANSVILDAGNYASYIKYVNLYEARASTTTLNKTANYVAAGAMFHLVASSSTSATDNGKTPMGDANILQMNWDNNGGYDAQLGIHTTDNRMEFRSRASQKQAWREVVTSTPGTAAGGETQPVYINTSGVATAIPYTIAQSVPADAVFTDHYAWGDITGKPTKITLTGAVTGNVTLGSGENSIATTVNHNHDDRYKIASGVITLGSSTITPVTSVNGHQGASVNVTASDLGLASALKYVGTKSSLPTATDSTTYSTYNNGDVITVSNKEYAYVKGSNAAGSSWVELGDEGSYKLKQTAFTNSTGTADGSNTSTTFIYSFSQDANGVITDIKTRKLPTYNNYSHPTGDGNLHVPATGTDNNGKFLKAGSTAGSLSWATLAVADISDIGETYLKLTGGTMTGAINLVGNQSSAYNNKGLIFTQGSRIGENTSGGLGIYAAERIYLRPDSPTSSSGDGIEISGNGIIPSNNNTETLGDSSHKWSNVYATNLNGNLSVTTHTNTTNGNKNYYPWFSTATSGNLGAYAHAGVYIYETVASNKITQLDFCMGSTSITGSLTLWDGTNHWGNIKLTNLSANRNYTLPNQAGTFALLTQTDANALINLLDTGSSDLTANDYVITQYVGGGTTTTTYHRRPASKVINATLVKAALGTDTSTTTQWLNKKGGWSTPTAAQVGAITKLSNSTDNAIVRFDGTTGAIQDSGVTINDNDHLIAPAIRIANTYYGVSFGRTTGTPKETILHTGIKWVSSTHMPVIHITGYAYGLQSPVEFKIGFYIYGDKIGWSGATNMGSWEPDIYLFKDTRSETNYVAVGLAGSCYFLQLSVDLQDEMGKFNNVIPTDWSWDFLTTEGTIPSADDGTTCVKVPYKASIFGAKYASITTTSNAIAYYTNATGTFGSKASANGALYATSANGALQWGTLPIAQGGTGATSAADARTNLGLGSMATETATKYMKWQTTSSASTALYDFGAYCAQGTATGTGPNGSNYYNIINIPYRKASGNTKADWGWQLGNTTSNDSRMYYRTSGDNVWGDWQTIAHATTSANNIGSATQPVYMTAAGVITAGTALKDLAYIAKPSSNTTTTYLRGDGSWVGLADMGLSNVLHFIGVTTTDMTGGTASNHSWTGTPAGISNYTPKQGDVVINSTKQDEWVCTSVSGTTYTWERLGSDTSYKIVQSAVSDPTAASTTSTTFIDTISQDANGVISATKKTLPTASTSVAGIIKIGTNSTDAMAGDTNVTNVAFTAATDNNEYPILLKNSTGSTTTAASAKFANTTNKMTTINPSTGIITAQGLKIASNAATAHLAFSRTSWNYITMPNNDSSVISIGYGTPADNTTQRLVIYKTGTVRPGTNGSQNLGDDTHKWNNVYGVNFYGSTFSGTANKANYLRCFELEANADLNLIDSHADEGIFQNCWVGGGNASSIQNRPDSYGVASFGMLAFKIATNWTGQVLLSTNQAPGLYWRVNNNSSSPAYGTWARVWDSSNHRVFYGTCTEAAGTVAKTAACANYDEMKIGDIITVKFDNTNTAASPTLNVNGKGSKAIKMAYSGGYADLSSYAQLTGIRTFIYDGTNWILQEGECVKQEVTNGSESVWRGLMVGASNNASESFTPDPVFAKTYVTHNVKFQASTGTLRATKFKGTEFKLEYEHTDKAYMTWNNTDQSIDFIFV